MTGIFEFWSQMRLGDHVHPEDRDVLARVNHGFDLKCLPSSFAGKLRTAPVVLLYLSPGWSEQSPIKARSISTQEFYLRQYTGCEPFRDLSEGGSPWFASRTKCFGPWETVRHYVSVLNVGAYQSKTFEDGPLLAALPSSRVALSYAQEVLFPLAMNGKRVVVCLRAARFWGLEVGERYGEALFAPEVTRSGYMKRDALRELVVQTVKTAIAKAADRAA